ncbi:hypothetical protein [Mucilaginibacter sp. KACC 22063]|uniref:hypothetical protein n=1 Tax=Mucilaginibacter sp. KACC 22063 TaxID=3025666 RepID=UPI0023658256|nr:hypothetical protein [Mucilaginibacter sp. KACC 22063]WDF54882.1 hypothetical protein PQ461_18290 [Mucilaginibacter sp. KACC 22063]
MINKQEIKIYESESNIIDGLPKEPGSKHYKFNYGDKEYIIGVVFKVPNQGIGFAFHIHPDFQGNGIGKQAFVMAYNAFSKDFDINSLKVSGKEKWNIGIMRTAAQ